MTACEFNQLPQPEQLRLAFGKGTMLARHWYATGSINLYYLPTSGKGFYLGIASLDAPACPVQWVWAFPNWARLRHYVARRLSVPRPAGGAAQPANTRPQALRLRPRR